MPKDYTVVGTYPGVTGDTSAIRANTWVEWVRAEDPVDATREARALIRLNSGADANNLGIVAVFRGHQPDLYDGETNL